MPKRSTLDSPTSPTTSSNGDSTSPLASTFTPGATGAVDEIEWAIHRLLVALDPDAGRDGLADTPRRLRSALVEMTTGYAVDVAALLATTFESDYDEMVVVRGIEFVSLCEHHLLPFTGHATVAYIPTDRVVGLSKIPRVVEAFARRLQMQERLTQQIAHALDDNLHPQGVGVVVTARHSCMSIRGVRKNGAEMVTSCLTGVLRDQPDARAELLALHRT